MSYFASESWDSDPVSHFTPYSPNPCHSLETYPALSPLHYPLSPVWLQPIPLPDVAYQAAKGAHISYPPSPVNEECSPSPEHHHSSPVQSPVQQESEGRTFTIFDPVPGTNHLKSPSPILETTCEPSPQTHSWPTLSPVPRNQSPLCPLTLIDYEAVAQRVRYQSLPCVPSPENHPDQENIPPIPVHHPLCVHSRRIHPHQFIAVQTPIREEWHLLTNLTKTLSLTFTQPGTVVQFPQYSQASSHSDNQLCTTSPSICSNTALLLLQVFSLQLHAHKQSETSPARTFHL